SPHETGGKTIAQDFAQLMEELKSAVTDFQNDSTPEKFGAIITALGAFGITAAELGGTLTYYAKKHPVWTALGAGVVFYALKGLLVPIERRVSNREMGYH